MIPHAEKNYHGHQASAGPPGGAGHFVMAPQYPLGMLQAMQRMTGPPPPPPGTGRLSESPQETQQDYYRQAAPRAMEGAMPHFGRQMMGDDFRDVDSSGFSRAYLTPGEQIETLIKMVLNALIVQDEDQVFVPYGIAKRDSAGKGTGGAGGGSDTGGTDSELARERHAHVGETSLATEAHGSSSDLRNGEGVHDTHGGHGVEAPAVEVGEDTVSSNVASCAGENETHSDQNGDMGPGGIPRRDGSDEVKDEFVHDQVLSPDITGILRACLKKTAEHTEASLRKHVNKVLKAAPFHMSTGPVYFYTPDTPRNELERADRVAVVRGWAYRDPLTEEHLVREGLCRIPPIYRMHKAADAHCEAVINALDAATAAVHPLPHKKAMRGRRMKGSRGFKPLAPEDADKEFEPGSETWAWKFLDNGRLQWCDRKERRWYKCSQCRFMRENRAHVAKHFETSCRSTWEAERKDPPPTTPRVGGRGGGGGGRGGRGRNTAPRLSNNTHSIVGSQGATMSGTVLPDLYIKALALVDNLLEDGALTSKQAQRMRWLCMWRQPPITVLMMAYGNNPDVFAIRCKELLEGMESSAASGGRTID